MTQRGDPRAGIEIPSSEGKILDRFRDEFRRFTLSERS